MSESLTRAVVGLGLSPNQVSVVGMVCGMAAGAALFATAHVEHARLVWLGAGVLIQARLLANMLDGMVAVATGKTSPLGEIYNDVPDRVSDSCVLIGLGYAVGGSIELGFAAALLAMMTAYIRATGKAAGAGQDFRGPMAKQQRMFLVTCVAAFETLAPAAWRFQWGPRGAWGLGAAVLLVIATGSLVTCVRRLAWIGARLAEKAS